MKKFFFSFHFIPTEHTRAYLMRATGNFFDLHVYTSTIQATVFVQNSHTVYGQSVLVQP